MVYRRQLPRLVNCNFLQRLDGELHYPSLAERKFSSRNCATLPSGRQAPRLLMLDGHGSYVSVEFMWECKQNSVGLLFLPAHFSHVLQPPSLGTLLPSSPDTERELPILPALAVLHQSRSGALSSAIRKRVQRPSTRLLRSGWVAAGPYPWSPSKGLNSPQIRVVTNPPHPATSPPSATPKRPSSDSHGDCNMIPPLPVTLGMSIAPYSNSAVA